MPSADTAIKIGRHMDRRILLALLESLHVAALLTLAVLVWLVPDGPIDWRWWCAAALLVGCAAAVGQDAAAPERPWASIHWWKPALPYACYALIWIASWWMHPSPAGNRGFTEQIFFLAVIACVARIRQPSWLMAAVLVILGLIGLQVLGPASVVMANNRAVHYKSLDQWGGYPEIGMLTAIGSAACLAIALVTSRAAMAVATALLSAALAGTTVYMLSRSAMLTIAAVAPWLAIVAAWRFKSRRAMAFLAVMLAASIIVAVRTSPADWSRLAARMIVTGTELDMRAEGWRVAVAMLRDHPLLGIGPGRYPEEQPRYSKLNDPAHAYNILLHTGAELGGLGLAAYALIWGRLLVRTLRRMRGSTAALTAFAAHAMLLTFLLRSQSEHFLANLPASFRMLLVAGFLLGLAEAASRRAPRESDGLAL